MEKTAISKTKVFIFLFAILVGKPVQPSLFGPSDFGECVLEELKSVQNKPAARARLVDCLKRFPGGFDSINPKKNYFSRIKTWRDCVLRYGSDTSSEFAATRIRGVCVRLYPPK